ncbi:MAG TPA: hypothetical protein VMU93_16615 [Caulobacteraceae bacterium]|nr:hypothetical protein [Caulobacteraceae bacterium]
MSAQADEEEGKIAPLGATPLEPDDLPYAVVMWNLPRTGVERVLARAASASLARAIFVAAQSEHLGRRIVLLHGARTIAESG